MPSDVPIERLTDIITNIDRIRAHLKDVTGGTEFDEKTRDAVERCLERISEAAKKLGSAIEEAQPNVPWRNIRGLGNGFFPRWQSIWLALVRNCFIAQSSTTLGR